MPNWTYNTLTVRGTKGQITKFCNQYLVDNNFDFNKVIPEPQKEEDCPSDCIRTDNDHVEIFKDRPWFNWYNWRYRFWGVKWNAHTNYVDQKDNSVEISFDTPWCPPTPIIAALRKQNPNLSISFYSEDE